MCNSKICCHLICMSFTSAELSADFQNEMQTLYDKQKNLVQVIYSIMLVGNVNSPTLN